MQHLTAIEQNAGRIDRRNEARCQTTGQIQLNRSTCEDRPFVGNLVNAAPTGFRASHDQLDLQAGTLVDFAFEGHRGVARTIWTRIVGGQAESGFRICEDRPPPAC
jgi:hypothetical protein